MMMEYLDSLKFSVFLETNGVDPTFDEFNGRHCVFKIGSQNHYIQFKLTNQRRALIPILCWKSIQFLPSSITVLIPDGQQFDIHPIEPGSFLHMRTVLRYMIQEHNSAMIITEDEEVKAAILGQPVANEEVRNTIESAFESGLIIRPPTDPPGGYDFY